jgi:hypothetical protein
MRTLLTWHIYAGILGPILALLHTGHKFSSPVGIALTAMALFVVFSGFAGRYLTSQFAQTIHEKKQILTALELKYRDTATELAARPEQAAILRPASEFLVRLAANIFIGRKTPEAATASFSAIQLANAIADVEYAIKTHEMFKRFFAGWLKFHILISLVLYGLLGLHVWAGVYFGLRWFK